MAQDVPHSGDALEITLHGVNSNLLGLAVHNNAESRAFIHRAVVDIAKHGVHQAHGARRVLTEHLIQHLPQASRAHLHVPLWDGVLDGRHQNMVRLHSEPGGLADGRRRWLHDHAKVDTGLGIEPQDGHQRQCPDHRGGQSAPKRKPRTLGLAAVLLQRRQGDALAHQKPSGILGDGAQGREDGHVACVQVLGDHEVAGVGTSEDDGQALWVEQIHESLALGIGLSHLGEGVLGILQAGRFHHPQNHQHGTRLIARGVLLRKLPVGHLLVAINRLGWQVQRRLQGDTGLAHPNERPRQMVQRVVAIQKRVLTPVRAVGALQLLLHAGLCLDAGHCRSESEWARGEHVLTPEPGIHHVGESGVVASTQDRLHHLLFNTRLNHARLHALFLRSILETQAIESHLGTVVDLGDAIPREAPSQDHLQAPHILGMVPALLGQQTRSVLGFCGDHVETNIGLCLKRVAASHHGLIPIRSLVQRHRF
mmetsp:Transcript_75798/g.181235  ORF Transcript_75798/g.181235 Transcript_75798/m.181235 type:complete len:480 (-) Transcript_75798:3152-4591(-)